MSSESGEKFFLGLIVGAVLGLAIGIFNAPRPGEESRQIVKAKLVEFGKKIKHETGDNE